MCTHACIIFITCRIPNIGIQTCGTVGDRTPFWFHFWGQRSYSLHLPLLLSKNATVVGGMAGWGEWARRAVVVVVMMVVVGVVVVVPTRAGMR